MIASTANVATSARPDSIRSSRAPFIVPDAIIRTYFALFPAFVALFLTVQAVRAQIPDVGANITPVVSTSSVK